jgi:Kef-type K+ transport system membrane component KefB
MGDWFPITDPVMVFAVVSALILVAPFAAAQARLPGIIGLILAGALLGPNGLNVLARDQAIVLLGSVGLIYIMFTAALEIDLEAFKRYGLQSGVFGVFTFAIPQGLGTVVAHYLLGFSWPSAILLASMFASHTLLAYPIASRLGLAKNPAVVSTVGGTMITDTAALMVLAVIAGMARGEVNEAFWWRLGVGVTVYVGLILLGLPHLGRWFFRRVRNDGTAEYLFVVVAVFACAAASHAAGLEPIVGAFLAGLALNRLIPHGGALMNRLAFTGDAIFVPFFLIGVGMLIDARVLFGGSRTLIVAGTMLAIVLGAKFAAAHLTRRIFRFSAAEGHMMFGLSVAQAAATLAAVFVGFDIGLFDDSVVNGAVVMILGTCIVAALVVERAGQKVAEVEAQKVDEGGPLQRILVPLANARTSEQIIDLAMLLREPSQRQPIYPLHVVRDGADVSREVAYGESMLAQIAVRATAAEVPSQPVTRVDTDVPVAIARARKELRITDIVLGWTGPGDTAGLGPVIEGLLADTQTHLFVCRLPLPVNTVTRVLLALPPRAVEDPGFESTLSRIKRVAAETGAPLVVMPERNERDDVVKAVARIKPSCKLEPRPLEQWSALVQALADRAADNDLIVLYAPRDGAPSWNPAERSLAAALALRFPGHNLIAAFASHAPPEIGPADAAVREAAALFVPDRVILGLENLAFDDAVGHMLDRALDAIPKDHRPPHDAFEGLAESCREVAPGLVLLHRQSRRLEHPIVVAAASPGGIDVPYAGETVHLLLLVLTPCADDVHAPRAARTPEDLLLHLRPGAAPPVLASPVRFSIRPSVMPSAIEGPNVRAGDDPVAGDCPAPWTRKP